MPNGDCVACPVPRRSRWCRWCRAVYRLWGGDRRRPAARYVSTLLVSILGATVAAGVAETHGEASRPNVIVIMTDDQDQGSMTSFMTKPGGVTRMRTRGATFANSFVTYALCCPSRASFLTGQYPHNHGVAGNPPESGYGMLDHSNTLAVWLQAAGYHTALIGKYLNGYGKQDTEAPGDARHEIPAGWSEWYAGSGASF